MVVVASCRERCQKVKISPSLPWIVKRISGEKDRETHCSDDGSNGRVIFPPPLASVGPHRQRTLLDPLLALDRVDPEKGVSDPECGTERKSSEGGAAEVSREGSEGMADQGEGEDGEREEGHGLGACAGTVVSYVGRRCTEMRAHLGKHGA
jgi:hypothetical protein